MVIHKYDHTKMDELEEKHKIQRQNSNLIRPFNVEGHRDEEGGEVLDEISELN